MMHNLLQPTDIALHGSSSVAHLYAPGSWLKSLGQQSRSPSVCLIFTRRLLSRDRDRRRNWPRTERSQKVSDANLKKVSGRRFKTRSVGLVEAETFYCLAPRYYVFDDIVIIFCRCDIGNISSVHQSRWSKFQSSSFSNVLALFVVVGVMREREEAGEPPPLPELQEPEISLKELRPLKGAKSAIWLHFSLRVVEAKFITRKSNVGTVELLWSTYSHFRLVRTRLTRNRPFA